MSGVLGERNPTARTQGPRAPAGAPTAAPAASSPPSPCTGTKTDTLLARNSPNRFSRRFVAIPILPVFCVGGGGGATCSGAAGAAWVRAAAAAAARPLRLSGPRHTNRNGGASLSLLNSAKRLEITGKYQISRLPPPGIT